MTDPAARLQRRMQLAVNRRLQNNLREVTVLYRKTERLATVAERYGWNWKFEPDDTYRFSYGSLQLSSLLQPAALLAPGKRAMGNKGK